MRFSMLLLWTLIVIYFLLLFVFFFKVSLGKFEALCFCAGKRSPHMVSLYPHLYIWLLFSFLSTSFFENQPWNQKQPCQASSETQSGPP